MQAAWITVVLFCAVSYAANIDLLECDPPDQPRWGGYGPHKDSYLPGDVIHYFCDVDTHIGGNYYRKCLDTGHWTGDTPVCDMPAIFSSTKQSSTAKNHESSENAVDGLRTTCTSTKGGPADEWYGIFKTPGELIRVMVFLPKGPVSYEVVLVKPNGEEVICGSLTANIDRYDWYFQNCPGPNNRGASGVKIRSLNNSPLKICEITAHVLTSPTCVDPHYPIEGGHLRLDRKSAELKCDTGYARSTDTTRECVRDGEWNKKTLYCIQQPWELDEREPESPWRRKPSDHDPTIDESERERFSDHDPRRKNPRRERLEV